MPNTSFYYTASLCIKQNDNIVCIKLHLVNIGYITPAITSGGYYSIN